ncbi:unnamed protein product [Caenorhabditis bovis]|uniref:Aminopeptidase N-like N-terminal domain-containing protein n=1 Tax=Caenorhabditis bovis TaxID=2654633 RepID=A0A8S1EIG3_9PELO|nr:unnamed protein product [Caenorhabditis bovis]
MLLSTLLFSIVYAVVVFGSMVNKTILPTNNVPQIIPYITIPYSYDIYLQFFGTPTQKNSTFTGKLFMNFTARDVTQRLFFHRGEHLNIEKIYLEKSDGKRSVPNVGAYNKNTQIQAYIPISNLTKDKSYVLTIEYCGTIGALNAGPNYVTYHDDLDVEKTDTLTSITTFPALFPTESSEIALSLISTDLTKNSVQQQNMTINKYYRESVLTTISTERILQFMSPKSKEIGKVDVIALPDLQTIQQPGITFLNEQDVLRENIDLGLN